LQSKTKTIIFGAGAGAKKFLENEKLTREFLAVCDNDLQKQGTLFEGYDIISPKKLKEYDYDQIVITTQWATQVLKQLTEELKVNPSKIVVPPKALLKKPQPFYHKETKDLARTIITTLSKSAKQNNVPLFIDFGTLLGIVRDNDVIEWDDDIDFAVPLEKYDAFAYWFEKEFHKLSFLVDLKIQICTTKEAQTSYISLFFEDSRFNSFITTISFRQRNDLYSLHLPSGGMWYAPKKHFETFQTKQWNGVDLMLPYEYEEYLTFVYGEWQKPKKNISMTDYANLGEVSFEEFEKIGFELNEIKE
jgi:lipopolysaccharide cholinephosphotransferase